MVESMPSPARAVRLFVPVCLFICAAACVRTAPRSLPATGTVTVGVTSRGPGVEAMAFAVSVEPAGMDGSVKGGVGVFTARNVPAGSHVVQLKDLPRECRVDGDAERKISVSAGRSTVVRFVVVCT
jgi:hypothetical protein